MSNNKYFLGMVMICVGMLLISYFSYESSVVKVIFCDVGQGDGIVITKANWQLVVDVGSDNGLMLKCLSKHLPWWDKKLEAVVITHRDADHSGSLAKVYKYYKIENLYSNRDSWEVNEQKFYAVKMNNNDVIRHGEMEYEVLSSGGYGDDDNDNSLVGLWKYKDKKILLMGDVSLRVEEEMVWRKRLEGAVGVDILKIGHHGSEKASGKELLDLIKPKRVVVSVGKNNRVGHPSKKVLEDLAERKIIMDRTDLVGDVTVVY